MTKRYKPAAHYEVLSPVHGLIGHVRRGVLVLLGETEGYSGIVHCEIDEASKGHPYGGLPYVARRSARPLGRLVGLEIIGDDGTRLQLRQIPRDPAMPACADTFRAQLDVCQVLAEQGHARASMLRAALAAAPFDPCPTCGGQLSLVDDCNQCGGYGFVPEV